MGTLKLCEIYVVPPVTHPTDFRSVFRDEERKGKLIRWECFRLGVEGNFQFVRSAPATLINRWELTTTLSSHAMQQELQAMTAVQSWQLYHLLCPRDMFGAAEPSLFRRIRRGLVMMHVSSDEDVLPLVDVSLPNHGNQATLPFILKLLKGQSEFYAGLSLFSLRVNP